jgi:hypothetical protein
MAGRRARNNPGVVTTASVAPHEDIKPPYDAFELQNTVEHLAKRGVIEATTLPSADQPAHLLRLDTPFAEHFDAYGIRQRLLGVVGVECSRVVARPSNNETGDVVSYTSSAAIVHAEVPIVGEPGRTHSMLTLTKTGKPEMYPDDDYDVRARWRRPYIISEANASGEWEGVVTPGGAALRLSFEAPDAEDAWWSTPFLATQVSEQGAAQIFHAYSDRPVPDLSNSLGHMWAGQSDRLMSYVNGPTSQF